MSLKLLVTDAVSPLGQALLHDLEREPFNLLVPGVEELDWTDLAGVDAYIHHKSPDLVVNSYALDQLMGQEGCDAFVRSAASLASACGARNIPVVHISSYQVFGGDSKSTHSEKDLVNPVNEAGRALVAAEQELEVMVPRHISLRTSWVIGAYGDNLLTRLLDGYLGGRAVLANRRLRGAPTTMADFTRVIVALVKQITCGAENWGVMHYCSGDVCTEEEFAEHLLQLIIQQQLLTAEPSLTIIDDASTEEPPSSILTCRNIRDGFGIQPRSWRPSLLPLVRQWLHNWEQQ
jgi:dTDP-4-dehydrorhamnose reductase